MKDKPIVGIYIDGANLFYQTKQASWRIDYKKLYHWFKQNNRILIAKYFIGKPFWEPAISKSIKFNSFLIDNGYFVITKPLKKIKLANNAYKYKCNFDIEIHDEIINDLDKLDIVYLLSGDSDFIRTRDRVISKNKSFIFLAYKKGCAFEIRKSKHILLDKIKDLIEKI